MSVIPMVSEKDAQRQVARIFKEFRKTLGTDFVPNFFKTLANSQAVMEGTWKVYHGTCRTGSVPTYLKEMIFAAISTVRGCHYCETAHLAFAKVSGADTETLAALTKGIAKLKPGKTRDVIRFAIKCAMNPRTVTEADHKMLREHGFSVPEIVEIVGTSAFAMYATTIADVFQIQTDPEFFKILEYPTK